MRFTDGIALAAAILAFSGCATAPVHAERTAIRGAMVFDGLGADPFPATVVIEDGLISEVLPPEAAVSAVETIDASGLALVPGLLDLHTHFTPNGDPAFAPQTMYAFAAAGVTTVNDFHQPPVSFGGRRAWYENLDGPDVMFAARMSTTGGHGADWADTQQTKWVDTPFAAREAVEALVPFSPDLIKVFTDGWRYGSGIDNTSMNLPTLTELVTAAHENDLKVVTHTVTVDRAKIAAKSDVDVIVHSILDGPVDQELIDLMLASGTAYAPTLAVYEVDKPAAPPVEPGPMADMRRARFAVALKNVKTLHDAGVRVALGTDSGMRFTPHGASSFREMELLVSAGLSPAEALVVATSASAEAMGYSDRGVIAKGRRADIVLVEGEPWRDVEAMRSIARTIVGGRTIYVAGDTRPQVEILPPAVVPPSVVADFEAGEPSTNEGGVLMLDLDSGVQRSSGVMKVVDIGNGNKVLAFMGRMTLRREPRAGVIFPMAPDWVAPADVSGFTGLSFRFRGDGEYLVGVQTPGALWTSEIEGGAKWDRVLIPFDQLSGSEDKTWSGKDVVSMRVVASGAPGEAVWFEIDDVELY